MKPQDVQVPKGMVLLCTVQHFCDITNFAEPEDILNLGGRYEVQYRVCTWHGEPKTVKRSFHSKTYHDQFVALLRSMDGVVVLKDGDFKVELAQLDLADFRFVKEDGTLPVEEILGEIV